MKQVFAGIVAVALVAGAWYVRTNFIDDDEAVAGNGGTQDGGGTQVDDDLVIACDEQLDDACPAGSTRLSVDELISTFADPAAEFDVLVAPSIVVQMIEESGRSRARFAEDRPAVATTAVVFAVAAGEATAVAETCGASAAITWECLADQVMAGTLEPSFENPITSSEGIVSFAALTGGFFSGAGLAFNRNNFGAEFTGWLEQVRGVQPMSNPVQNIILRNGAENDSAAALEAVALDVVGRAAQGGRTPPLVDYPAPLAGIAVVAVAIGDTDPNDAAEVGDAVGEALRSAGWRDADGATTLDAPPLPGGDDGLPTGGVLDALQDAWS